MMRGANGYYRYFMMVLQYLSRRATLSLSLSHSGTTELSYEDGMSEAQLRDELEAAQLSCLESGELPPLSATESMTWIWVLAKK